jgi:3-oxoacyl-[acyl-carrier protein] reductase
MNGLSDRVALVTGSSAGLGLAAAMALAQRGARLAISSRDAAKLAAAAGRLADTRAEVITVPADVRNPDQLEELVSEVEEKLGPIDILIANGGGPRAKPASELDEVDWQEAIPLTLLFVPRLCRLVLPGMRRRGWGRIVAINSVSSRQPIPGLALSNALRPAVLGYLKTLSQEVASDGVTVNAVLPGYTRTERLEELAVSMAERTGRSAADILAEQGSGSAMRRLAEPREIGDTVAFLASPEASYITGQSVVVDGGYHKGLF